MVPRFNQMIKAKRRWLLPLSVPFLTGLIAASSLSVAPAGDPGANLTDEFSVLEGEVEPAEAAQLFHGGGPFVDDFAPVTEAAQVVSADGDDIAIVPGGDGLCVADASAQACTTAENAEAGDLYLTEACVPGVPEGFLRVTGVVPDDVTQIHVTLASNEALNVPVVDNAYRFDANTPVRNIEISDGSKVELHNATAPANC